MAQKKLKKDFDKDMMYQKIMPSISSNIAEELGGAQEEPAAAPPPLPAASTPKPQPKYILRNFMEDMVLERLNDTIQRLKGCECEKCKKDVMAIVLNSLPAAYRTVLPEDVDAAVRSLRGQYEIKLMASMITAIQTIKQTPSHDG